MGVWALRLALVAWCCAVMFYSRRCSCGQASAVMGLNLVAILHARAEMVRGYLALGKAVLRFQGPGGVGRPSPGSEAKRGGGARRGGGGGARSPPSARGFGVTETGAVSQYMASLPLSISCSLVFCSGVSTLLTSNR